MWGRTSPGWHGLPWMRPAASWPEQGQRPAETRRHPLRSSPTKTWLKRALRRSPARVTATPTSPATRRVGQTVTNSQPNIRLKNVSIIFGDNRALDAVNLEIPARQVVGLVGENGSGKSTLIKILNGVY